MEYKEMQYIQLALLLLLLFGNFARRFISEEDQPHENQRHHQGVGEQRALLGNVSSNASVE
eukprot:CAMPEP_0194208088 /NCGR_PEP_ID=MMETSP0156-20130528/6638_1 /TAXON_ID=33649 /ORGANISM="Thalassionema nitzschioides, Strain L26-B" /LENGTH=60 /DNA_ID=CAMNT_0038934979 /DNA_START=222 /DNA_END=404 /DNA_ORIENTATION=+